MKGANKRLGELLIQERLLVQEQLEESLEIQERVGGFIGRIFVEKGYLTEDTLITFLVKQCRIPPVKLSTLQISEDVAHLIPEDIIKTYQVLPVDQLGNLVTIAMVNPLDIEALEKIKSSTSFRIKPLLCTWYEFEQVYEHLFSEPAVMAPVLEEAGGEESGVTSEASKAPVGEETAVAAPPVEEPSEEEPVIIDTEPSREEQSARVYDSHLITHFTFENFVVSEANSFTVALAKSVGQAPGKDYNPLFIYGKTGLGKTHLANAIGNELLGSNGSGRVQYIAANSFSNNLVEAIRQDKVDNFRREYEDIDILIVDDIQFLAGRERAQEEFFHIFNAIYNCNKQIVVVSDVPPTNLDSLEKRLISRFEGGVVTSLQAPDFETRMAILKQYAKDEMNTQVSHEVLALLASKISANVRVLQGVLKKLVGYSRILGHETSIDLCEEILRHYLEQSDEEVE